MTMTEIVAALGLPESADAAAVMASAQAGRAAQARVIGLEADLAAALKTVAATPPPAKGPDFKVGDKVTYRDREAAVAAILEPEVVYELEDGECAPQSRCKPMSADAQARVADAFGALRAHAAAVRSRMDDAALRGLAVRYATGGCSLTQVLAEVSASPAVPAGAIAALRPPSVDLGPELSKQDRIRARVGAGRA